MAGHVTEPGTSCCPLKSVGGVSYTLIEDSVALKDDSNAADLLSKCQSKCLYKRNDMPWKIFCFEEDPVNGFDVVCGGEGILSDYCYPKKRVGGVNYTLIPDEADTSAFGCHSQCVYEMDDRPGSRFCFEEGDLPVLSGDDEISFDDFIKEFNKTYSENEKQERIDLWKENAELITEHNKLYENGEKTYKQSVNMLSDMRFEEIEAYYMGLIMPPVFSNSSTPTPYPPYRESRRYPNTNTTINNKTVNWKDLGHVTPVKDQYGCGACWAFSAIGAIESAHSIHTNNTTVLSESNVIDCSKGGRNQSCAGGHPIYAFNRVLGHGIDTKSSYSENETCKKEKQEKISISEWSYVGENEDALRDAVDAGPVSALICVGINFMRYRGGDDDIFFEENCNRPCYGSFNHAVLVVGYGNNSKGDYWLVKNSWGTHWGEEGYIKMARNRNNNCGIASRAIFPIVSGEPVSDIICDKDLDYLFANVTASNGSMSIHCCNLGENKNCTGAECAVACGSNITCVKPVDVDELIGNCGGKEKENTAVVGISEAYCMATNICPRRFNDFHVGCCKLDRYKREKCPRACKCRTSCQWYKENKECRAGVSTCCECGGYNSMARSNCPHQCPLVNQLFYDCSKVANNCSLCSSSRYYKYCKKECRCECECKIAYKDYEEKKRCSNYYFECCDCAGPYNYTVPCPKECKAPPGVIERQLGVLVTGGAWGGAERSTQLYLPATGKTCSLASLPDNRVHHSMDYISSQVVLCSGGSNSTSCLKFLTDSSNGSWASYATMAIPRNVHTTFVFQDKLLLMGGSSTETTEILGQGQQYNLQIGTRYACSIPDISSTILVGGIGGTSYRYLNTAVRYDMQGFVENLPSFRQARRKPGCGSYTDQQNIKVLVVAGGTRGSTYFSSTEILREDATGWAWAGSLPRTLSWMASVSMEDYVLLIGGIERNGEGNLRGEILKFDGTWTEVGRTAPSYNPAATKMLIGQDLTGQLNITGCY